MIKCSAGKRDTVVEILIVEDDPNIARTIEVTISLVGYECRICGDGAAAVQEVLEHDYDLVLLDVMLPGMDGFEVIQKIWRASRWCCAALIRAVSKLCMMILP